MYRPAQNLAAAANRSAGLRASATWPLSTLCDRRPEPELADAWSSAVWRRCAPWRSAWCGATRGRQGGCGRAVPAWPSGGVVFGGTAV